MALFNKLNEKINIEKVKKDGLNEADFSKVENELLFGNLMEDVVNIFKIADEETGVLEENIKNADLELEINNDDMHHDNGDAEMDGEVPGDNSDITSEVLLKSMKVGN